PARGGALRRPRAPPHGGRAHPPAAPQAPRARGVAAAAGDEALGMGSVAEDITRRVGEGRIVTAISRLVADGPQVLLSAVPLGEGDGPRGGVLVYAPVTD